ncbi:MAG: PqqD family protein [Acholeplasmataceae bacterium]
MKINPDFILRDIKGQTVVVPTKASAVDFNGIITLNKSAKLLFEALFEETSKDDLVELLISQYEVDESTAESDVTSFLELLEKHHILL